MANKIQGEGDYESARRYNKHTTDSARKGFSKIPVRDGTEDEEQLQQAEQSGKQRAKELEHDETDASVMRQPVDRNSTR